MTSIGHNDAVHGRVFIRDVLSQGNVLTNIKKLSQEQRAFVLGVIRDGNWSSVVGAKSHYENQLQTLNAEIKHNGDLPEDSVPLPGIISSMQISLSKTHTSSGLFFSFFKGLANLFGRISSQQVLNEIQRLPENDPALTYWELHMKYPHVLENKFD